MSIPAEALVLPPAARGSLQERIRQMVIEAILAGRFTAGERMPSSRGLARHLGISRITVTLAYAELVSSDYLTSRGRSGYFVSDTAPSAPEITPRLRAPEAADVVRLLPPDPVALPEIARPRDWETYPYSFIYGQTDPAVFDHQNWRLCAVRALGRRDFGALTQDYYDGDDPLLVEYLLKTILPRRGILAQADEVLLTLGAQNALWMVAATLLGQGRRAAVENPGYPGLRAVLAATGTQTLSIDVDADGLPPDALPGGLDAVFTTASHQCPTNATMPLDRRMALLEAAQRRGFVVIEDDYDFEMSFLKPVSPALKSLDADGRVIHAGSFSKSVFPGLRLGYLVGPPSFIRAARRLRMAVLRHPPGHIQRTMAYFLSLGHYDALINRMRAAFRRRRQVMDEAIRAEGLTIAGQGGFGGSSYWMQAGHGINTAGLAQDLRKAGVLIEPGAAFFDPARPSHSHYRLGYASIAPARIPDGVARIADALKAA